MERSCQSPFRLNLRNRDSFWRFDQSSRFFDETTFNIDVSVIETRNSSEKYVDLPCARDVCKKERKKGGVEWGGKICWHGSNLLFHCRRIFGLRRFERGTRYWNERLERNKGVPTFVVDRITPITPIFVPFLSMIVLFLYRP